MRQRTLWMITPMRLARTALCLVALNSMRSQSEVLLALRPRGDAVLTTAAQRNSMDGTAAPADTHTGRLIVIGFVGGFVKRDDARHPEVRLAAELRRRYPSSIYVEVFGNHNREAAHRQVLDWLDTDEDGTLSAAEKQRARIIIYGHSWGASETVALARELGNKNIPVLLTIQVDSVGKPGQHDGLIPPNVANAVNFYQPDGLFHGRSAIVAADPGRTKILGNFRRTYGNQPVTTGGSSRLARLFMKSHIAIEDDPRIWRQVATLIDEQMSGSGSSGHTQAPGVFLVGR
jgi:hypothetical protein